MAATKQIELQCRKCDAVIPHTRATTNHVVHLLLSVFTAGIWLIVWILVALSESKQATCSKCGNKRQLTGAATVSK
jgi:hypothetical protein